MDSLCHLSRGRKRVLELPVRKNTACPVFKEPRRERDVLTSIHSPGNWRPKLIVEESEPGSVATLGTLGPSDVKGISSNVMFELVQQDG